MKLRAVGGIVVSSLLLVFAGHTCCLALDQEAIAWIAQHAIPLESLEPGTGLADLQPLRESLSGARVVGLGEGTHGTREFFTLRHRLMEFLVASLSFRAFAFEFPYGEGELIDQYIKTGEGSPADVLARVYCTPWNHQEMLDTIEWMREYNVGRSRSLQIGFHGIDIHDGDSSLLIDAVLTYIEGVAPEKLPEYESRLDGFRYRSMYHISVFSDADGSCREGLEWVVDDLEENESEYEAASDSTTYDVMLHRATLLHQRADLYATTAQQGNGDNLRDEYMAANVLWLLNHLGGKIAFSGANYHVGKFRNLAIQHPTNPETKTSSGWHIGQRLGPKYVVLGTTTKSGELAIFPFPGGRRDQWALADVPRVGFDGHATLLRAADIPNLILDLRLAGESETGTGWMAEANPLLSIGTAYIHGMSHTYKLYTPLVPCFDLIAYIETTSAPTMFEWVPMDDLEEPGA